MSCRKNSQIWPSVKRLVRCIADGKDFDDLIFNVARDIRLLETAREVYLEWRSVEWNENESLLELCRLHGISEEYFDKCLCLIVHTLNLVSQPENYYELLGVARDVSKDEIKRAYRQLSLVWHPDTNPGDDKAAERFRLIHEAYSTLSDGRLRALYDRAALVRNTALVPSWGKEKARTERPPTGGRRILPFLACIVIFGIIGLGFMVSDEGFSIYWHNHAKHQSAQENIPSPEVDSNVGMFNQSLGGFHALPEKSVGERRASGQAAKERRDNGEAKKSDSSVQPFQNNNTESAEAFMSSSDGAKEEADAKPLIDAPVLNAKVKEAEKPIPIPDKVSKDIPPPNGPAKSLSADHSKSDSSAQMKSNSATGSKTNLVSSSSAKPSRDVPKDDRNTTSQKANSAPDTKETIQSFLDHYCRTYQQKNLIALFSLFEPDAAENNVPIQQLVFKYNQTFQNLEKVTLRLRLFGWNKSEDAVIVNASLVMHSKFTDKPMKEISGSMVMRLVHSGGGFRIKELNYTYDAVREISPRAE